MTKRKPAYYIDVCIVRPRDQDALLRRARAGDADAMEVARAIGSYLDGYEASGGVAGLKCACCEHRFVTREQPGAISALTVTDLLRRRSRPIRSVAFGICERCAGGDDDELRANVYRLVTGFFDPDDCMPVPPPGHA